VAGFERLVDPAGVSQREVGVFFLAGLFSSYTQPYLFLLPWVSLVLLLWRQRVSSRRSLPVSMIWKLPQISPLTASLAHFSVALFRTVPILTLFRQAIPRICFLAELLSTEACADVSSITSSWLTSPSVFISTLISAHFHLSLRLYLPLALFVGP
jgi:hypothetical protein